MTSKKYSVDKKTASYDLKQAYKSIIVPAVITLIVMSENFLYNIWEMANSMPYDGKLNGLAAAKKLYSYYLISGVNQSIGASCCVLGILFALFSFNYMMRKKKVNVFFSLPVNRASMFKHRVLASVSIMAGTIIVPLIIDVIFNIYLFGKAAFIITMGFWILAESFVYMFTAFALMSLALALCYTMLEGTLLGLSFMGFPYIITAFCDQLNASFLDGYSRTSTFDYLLMYDGGYFYRPLFLETTIINPFMFGVPVGSNYPNNDIFAIGYAEKGFAYPSFKYILPIIVWAVVSTALMFLTKKVFINRKAEKAGIFSSNKPAIVFISVCISLFVSAYTALIFTDSFSKQVAAAFTVTMALLSFLAVSAILNKKIVLPKHSYASAAVITVFTLVFSVVLISGGFGYSSYVPESDKVEAAYISSNVIDDSYALTNSYQSYSNAIPEADMISNNNFGVFEGENDLKMFAETAKEITENDGGDGANTIYVIYKMKNGKNVYRCYNNVRDDVNYSVLSLTHTDSYINGLKSNLLPEKYGKNTLKDKIKEYGFTTASNITDSDADSYGPAEGQLSMRYYSASKNTKIPSNTPELREALLKDLLNTNPDQYFKNNEKSLCSISFTSYYELDDEIYEEEYDDVSYYATYRGDFTYRVYPFMTNTVNYLKSVGALKDEDIEISKDSIKAVYCISRNSVLDDKDLSMSVNGLFDNYTSFWYSDSDYGLKYAEDIDGLENANQIAGAMIDFSKYIKVTDAKTISELYSKSVDFRYCDNNEWYVLFEYDTDNINKRYLPMIVTGENMPDSIKSAKPSADKSNKSV